VKRVLVFSHEFPPDVGGAGVGAMQNACALSSNGYDVTVLTRERPGMLVDGSYKIVEVSILWKLWFLSYCKAVDFNLFDLIILNDPAAIYVAGMFFTSKTFHKSIVFLRGSEPELFYEEPSLACKLSFFKYFYNRSLKQCKKIYAVSNYMKEKFISRTGMDELWSKMFVRYDAGIVNPLIFFSEPASDFREKYCIPEDAVLLLSVSRIVKDKGYYEKFCLFKELCGRGENLYWVIVGNGEYLDELQELSKRNNLDNRILFIGRENRNRLRFFYSNADLFWLLSNYDEGFGRVYIEAQACGIPVIGRNRAGSVEAISDGISGFLVDNDEQVRNIIKNKLYKNISKSDITAFIKTFEMEYTIDAFIN